jgi:hypothetical protein
LPNSEFAAILKPGPTVGSVDISPSAAMSRDEFRRFESYPLGWSGWRSKR